MGRMGRVLGLLVVLALGFVRPAEAFLEGAEAAYRRGVVLEKQGNYTAALVEYQAALQHYPNYYYAYRQIGNCYVRLQQTPKAIEAYDQYLSAAPMDATVRDYNARLKQLQAPGAATAKPGPQNNGAYFVAVELTPLFLSADDTNALVPDGSTKAKAPLGLAYGVEGGWKHSSGFFVKAGFFTGASKSHTWKESSDLITNTMQSSLSGYYIAPGYDYKLPIGLPISVGGELQLGQAQISGKYSTEVAGSKTDNGFGQTVTLLQPRLKADYLLSEHLNLGASLGLNNAELGKVAIDGGNLKTQKNEDAKVSYNAPLLSVGASWTF